MREPKLYLSLTIVSGNAGFYRPLVNLTPLIAGYYIVKSLVHGVTAWLSGTVKKVLYDVHQGLSDALALATGLNKIGFVGIG